MFEKEAEDYSNNWKINKNSKLNFAELVDLRVIIYKANKDGAEFGYNKANEWHYVKDGDLPKENEYIMIYSKLADNIAVGKRRCAGKIRKRCVYEWYFATYEGTYCLRDKDIIAWKEIIPPKEIKENESK